MTKKEKVVEKRKETKEKHTGLVCRIEKGVEVLADPYQFILNNEGRFTFHGTISSVLDELLEYKEKELMIASKTKNMLSVKKAIEESQEWMENIVKLALKGR